MIADTSENGFESLIMRHATSADGLTVAPKMVTERPSSCWGAGRTAGKAQDDDSGSDSDEPELEED